MIWGQFVGDAAALGSHWLYSDEALAAAFPEGVRGFETPPSGHYHAGKQPGDQTHYGDASLVLLASVAEVGVFDLEDFAQRWFSCLTPRANYRGYFDPASRATVENRRRWLEDHPGEAFDYQQGADDDQMTSITGVAAIVGAHLRDPGLLGVCDRYTRFRQNNARALGYVRVHAELLRELVDGRDVHSALHRALERAERECDVGPELRQRVEDVLALQHRSVREAALDLGQSSPLYHSFACALHGFLRQPSDFGACIVETLQAGGEGAGRAALLGSWLGAHLGVRAIPKEWRDRLTYRKMVGECADRIVSRLYPDS